VVANPTAVLVGVLVLGLVVGELASRTDKKGAFGHDRAAAACAIPQTVWLDRGPVDQEYTMDTLDSRIWILGIVALLALLALAAWFFSRKKQSFRLAQRFGPEDGHTVDELSSRTKAEAELKTRVSRVEHLNIVVGAR
jgi:hypothetical protein